MTERSVCASISLTVGTTMDDEALVKHILDVLLIPDAIEATEILYVQKVEVDSIKPTVEPSFTTYELVGFTRIKAPELLKTIDPPLVELTSEGKKRFNDPLTIPIEYEKGSVHIFEGCYVKSVEYNYPADGPIVVEEVQATDDGLWVQHAEPGPDILGQEEYDRRQNDEILEAVKAIPSERLRWLATKDKDWLPENQCWSNFAKAVLKHRGEL